MRHADSSLADLEAVAAGRPGTRTCDPRDAETLQQLLYGLHALIDVHIWKEEELYISALDSSSWPN